MICIYDKIKNKIKFKNKKYVTLDVVFKVTIYLTLLICSCSLNSNNIYATSVDLGEEVIDEISESLELNDFISIIDETIESSGFNDIITTRDLSKGVYITPDTLFGKLIKLLFSQLYEAIASNISILVIIIVISILKTFELEKSSDIIKIANFVLYIAISTILLKSFSDILIYFKDTLNNVSLIMQIASPFLMGVLVVTGGVTAAGLIQPLILFAVSAISFLINIVVVPLIIIAVAFSTVHSLNEKLGLLKLSKFFLNTSLWTVGVMLTIFLGIMSLETTIASSVDSLAVKATSSAVSNFVPVVGKFFSDSFETVVGASKVVGNIGGTLGIIGVFLIAVVPVIKLVSISIVYSLFSALAEPLCLESKVTTVIGNFSNIYKVMLGIIIGVSVLFIISIAIIMNILSSIVS